MDREQLMNLILETLEDFEPEDVSEDSQFIGDLDLSSLEYLNLTNELESELDITITERDLTNIITVGDLITTCLSKLG